MSIDTGRMASNPTVKLFFPCSESGSSIDPADAITGGLYQPASANSGDGLKVTNGLEFAPVAFSGGTLPDIPAGSSAICVAVSSLSGGTAIVAVGGNSSNGWMALSKPSSDLKVTDDNGTTVQLSSLSFGSGVLDRTLVLDRDAGLLRYAEGGAEIVSVALPSGFGAVSLGSQNKLMFSDGDYYGLALYVFDDGLPDNWLEATQWIGERWANGQKVDAPNWSA